MLNNIKNFFKIPPTKKALKKFLEEHSIYELDQVLYPLGWIRQDLGTKQVYWSGNDKIEIEVVNE